ncbi:MAG: YkvA family protein [Candidatus Dormibacteria bacterium]
MLNRLRFVKRLFRDLPQQLRLAYCLFRDPRVPVATRAVFAGAMGLIVTPFIDLPEMIPVVGELDVLALSLLALKLFIAACPPEVVAQQEQLIIEQHSRFDQDVRNGERLATMLWERFHHDEGDGEARSVAGAPGPPDRSGERSAIAEKSGV